MNRKIKDRWLRALRGTYKDKKAKYILRNGDCFCALGVLCNIYAKDSLVDWNSGKVHIYGMIADEVKVWSGVKREIIISNLSDGSETFEPVISYIKENWREL